MKKTFLLLAALLAFGAASAQTDPKETPPPNPARTTPDVMDKAKDDAEIQNDVINRQNTPPGEEPRKAELKTREHVKSTPEPDRVRDTVKAAKKSRKTKRG